MMNKKTISTMNKILLSILLAGTLSGCARSVSSAASGSSEQEIERITLDQVKDMKVEYSDDTAEDAVSLLKNSLSADDKEDDAENGENDDAVELNGRRVEISADPSTIDTTVLGETDVTYTFAYDQNGRQLTDSKKIKITVQDTKPPVIHASHEYEIRLGQTFYPEKVIAEVIDPVDGPLERVYEEPAKIKDSGNGQVYERGWYTVNYSVNTKKKGTYSMQIHAADKHGLTADDDKINIIVNSRSWVDTRYTPVPEPEETASPTPETTIAPAEPTPAPTAAPATAEPEPTPAPQTEEPVPEPSEEPAQ